MADVIVPTPNNSDIPPNETVGGLRTLLTRFAMVVAAMLFLAFVIFVGNSFFKTAAAVDDYLPKSWNAAIERLGITPLYPPQEDIFVGDVFLAVAPSKRKFRDLPDDLHVDAMIGRSVKVGHINLTKYMRRPDDVRYFGDTARNNDGAISLSQPRRELAIDPADDGKIVLSNILFPAISLEREASVSGMWKSIGLGASSASAQKIVLSHVQSYGAEAYASTALLVRFCSDPQTLGFCIEKSSRAQLAYMMDDDVLRTATAVDDNKQDYVFEIRIFVVYRIYLARGMQVGSGDGINTRLFSSESAKPPSAVTTSIEVAAKPVDGTTPVVVKTENTDDAIGSAAASRGDKRIFWTNEPFNRPLAFGYRAVSMGMRDQ